MPPTASSAMTTGRRGSCFTAATSAPRKPLRFLRAQSAQFRLERVDALEQPHRHRQRVEVELETFTKALRGAHGDHACAAEDPLRRLRALRRQGAVLDQLAQ